ncbi:MAG: hypothetical protein KAR20_28355 [Candidatus Heimdallarchaeota archaeon]|nr:hypothetical protein [Candidatus Heimdallarchaeota archaeon]
MNRSEESKHAIVELLTNEKKCLFKTTIMNNLLATGMKKTNISLGLRNLRKEKRVCLYRRRWGLK